MWPQQAQGVYYSGWVSQSANPTPQATDPSDWAQKAAQWAQQKQIQEQQQYQQLQYEQQQQQQQYQQQQYQYPQQYQTAEYQQQSQYDQYTQQQLLQYQQQAGQEQMLQYQQQSQPYSAQPTSLLPTATTGQQVLAQPTPLADAGYSSQPQQAPPLVVAPPSQISVPVSAATSIPAASSGLAPVPGVNKPLFPKATTVSTESPEKQAAPPSGPTPPETGQQEPDTHIEGSQSSVDQELAQRMKLFKDQLAQISQGVDSGTGGAGSSPGAGDEGGDSRRGRGGGFRGGDRGGGYRGSDRGRGYRGSDRGGGYRGSDRGGGYRGSDRGGGYRGSDRGGGYRGSDRGGGYRGSDRGRGYRGSDRGRGYSGGYGGNDEGGGYSGSEGGRGGGYGGSDRGGSGGYRGSDRGGGYRGSERGRGGYRGDDRGSFSRGRGLTRENFRGGQPQGEPDFNFESQQRVGLVNPEFSHGQGSQRGLRPPYRGRGGMGNRDADSEKQGGLVNPDFKWRGRGGFRGGRGRGGGGQYEERQGSYGDSYDQHSRGEEEGYGEEYYSDQYETRGRGRGRGREGYGEDRSANGEEMEYSSQAEEDYGSSTGAGEGWSARDANQGGDGSSAGEGWSAHDANQGGDGSGAGERWSGRDANQGGDGYGGSAGEGWSARDTNQGGDGYGSSAGEGWSGEGARDAAIQKGDGYDGSFDQWQARVGLEGRKREDQGSAVSKYNEEGESYTSSYTSSHDPASLAKRAPENQSAPREDVPVENSVQLEVSQPSQSQYGEGGARLEDIKTSSKQSGPTISSLQKGGTTTVIPGLGSSDEPEEKASSPEKEPPPPQPKEEQELKSSLKTQLLDVFGGAKAAKMVQSMERIVNQLQTLRGLESSLKVLQGDQNKEPAATVTPKAEVTEVDQEAAARKQVAALLASESDSDGEGNDSQVANQNDSKPRPSFHSSRSQYDSSPSAREFDDSTYNSGNQPPYQEGSLGRGDYGSREEYGALGTREKYVARGGFRGSGYRGRGGHRERGDDYGDREDYGEDSRGGGYGDYQGDGDFRGDYREQGDFRGLAGYRGKSGRGVYRGRDSDYGGQDDFQGDPPEPDSYKGGRFEGNFRRRRGGDFSGQGECEEYDNGAGRDRDGRGFGDNFPQGRMPPPGRMESGPRNFGDRPDGYDRMRGASSEGERYDKGERSGDPNFWYPPRRMERRPPYEGQSEYGGEYRGRPSWQREDMGGGGWEMQDYDAPNPRGFSRNAATSFDHHHQHQAPLEPEPTEKLNISDKMETIDYSHGVSAAIIASRGWGADGGGGDEGGQPPTVQSVDYNHGQGAVNYAGGGGYPVDVTAAQGAYGGFPYSEYEGFPAGMQQFPQGIDAASLFAAYNEQAGADTKRKALPKWLKEELDKMEKKRQKALEKEAEELSKLGRREDGRPAWRDEDSDHEEAEPSQDMWKITPRTSNLYKPESPNRASSPEDNEPVMKRAKIDPQVVQPPSKDEEERKAEMMLKLRRMLTEILLDVTNEEIVSLVEDVYEEENAKFRFEFKAPKFKPKRAKPANVLASLSMYESSSDSDEEAVAVTGAKILSKPSKSLSSKTSSSSEKAKKKSKWDVTDSSSRSSSKKSSSSKSDSEKGGHSHKESSSKSRSSRHSSSSERSRRRRSSSRERSSSKSSSSKRGKEDSKSSSSSSRSRRHSSKSPPPSKSSKSSTSESSSASQSAAIVGAGGVVPVVATEETPTLSERWADLLPASVVIPKGQSRWDVQEEEKKEPPGRVLSPSHSLFQYQ